MASGIYKIENKVNGHCYVGSAMNIQKRWNTHISLLNKNKHHSRHLQNAFNKYGSDSFEFSVIEYCFPLALIFREQYWINKLKPKYNIALFAAAPNKGRVASAETRAKLSTHLMGNKYTLGYKHTAESRANMSAAMKLRPPASAETRAKISASNTGKIHTPEHTAKITAQTKGKKRSPHTPEAIAKMAAHVKTPEHRAKIGAAQKGKIISAETREKQSASIKAWWAKKKKAASE